MEVSGYVTRVWKYDGLTQMNVTNAFSFYIIRLAIPNQETVYQVADRIATIMLNRTDKGKPETFNFLGFTHMCVKKRSNGRYTVLRQTIRKRCPTLASAYCGKSFDSASLPA
jgi:hypothetical protein